MEIIEELKEHLPNMGSLDPYAECMEWLFTICHVIHHTYGIKAVPISWVYKPSPSDTSLDFSEYWLIECHNLHNEFLIDLIVLGNHLMEFREELEIKGMAY